MLDPEKVRNQMLIQKKYNVSDLAIKNLQLVSFLKKYCIKKTVFESIYSVKKTCFAFFEFF